MSTLDPGAEDAVVEQALRDGQLHKALLDHLEAGIYMVDRARRIVYWNRGAEQISGYTAQEVTGHFCQGDLLMHCDGAGRGLCGKACPLSTVMSDGHPREMTIFLRHRQGHRVPVLVRSRPIYDAAGAIVGAVEVFEQASTPAPVDRRALEAHGCLDPVTEIPNRRYGEFKLGQTLEAFRTLGISFGWLAVQLDEVEKLEHRYGHGIVDAAVKLLARTLDNNLGRLDLLNSWDTSEFRVEVHSCWGQGLAELTGRLLALIRASNLEWWGDPVRITVSIAGVTAEPGDTCESLEARVAAGLTEAHGGEAAEASQPGNDFVKLGDKRCLP